MTTDEAVSAVQQGTADVIAYIAEMGADPGLLALAFSYDSSDIRYLSGSEMARFRVTTEPPLEEYVIEFACRSSSCAVAKTGEELTLADFEREVRAQGITLYATIKEALPGEYEAFVREMMRSRWQAMKARRKPQLWSLRCG